MCRKLAGCIVLKAAAAEHNHSLVRVPFTADIESFCWILPLRPKEAELHPEGGQKTNTSAALSSS